MKAKVKMGSSKSRNEQSSKRRQPRAIRMTGEGAGYARGNKSTKRRRD